MELLNAFYSKDAEKKHEYIYEVYDFDDKNLTNNFNGGISFTNTKVVFISDMVPLNAFYSKDVRKDFYKTWIQTY